MKKIKKIAIIIPIIIFFVLLFLINKAFTSADDGIYQKAFYNISTFFGWMKEFYLVWSGRITISILINVLTNLPLIVFKICNCLVYLSIIGSGYIIIKILIDKISKNTKWKIKYFIFALFFLIPVAVLNSGTIWVAGALNYLWPFSLMLISIIPFIAQLKDKQMNNFYYILFILSNLLSCFSEQCGAVLIAFGAISLIYSVCKKKKISKLLIIHYITIVVLTVIALAAPGNAARYISEQVQWFPSYEMLSITDKLMQGYLNIANHLINNTTLLLLIISVISSFLIIKNKKIKKINKIITIIPIIYLLINLLPSNIVIGQYNINDILYKFDKFNITNLYSNMEMLKVIISVTMIGTIAGELIYIFREKKNGIITLILYLASISSGLAISFTPTIFASGSRIFVVTDFLLVLINSIVITEFFERLEKHQNIKQIIFLIVIICISAFMYIELYSKYLIDIIW